MAINYSRIKKYLNEVRKVEDSLSVHQELFDLEKLMEFKHITKTLEENVEKSKNDSRKLSIGIVGAVKAGKSSFLNALIFDGDEYLPKAATPMTAALTKITYSDTPKAVIHFYDKEDWEEIKKQSNLYDEGLQKEYDSYCERMRAQQSQYGYEVPSAYTQIMELNEYEKIYKCKSETQRGAKELTRMATDSALLNKLGGFEEIEGDIISKLEEYVGAKGRYTPIVSYVELQVDNPHIKDFEIVDTPGLNDPIVSRGIKTKQFLRSCDVVVLLSPCSQFMDAKTVTLMAQGLPDSGVHEILVVGSKLDSGILNESNSDFKMAWKKALNSYRTQFSRNLIQARCAGKATERQMNVLNKMKEEKVLFASSTCFSIDKKLKTGVPLDDNERKVYENLHTRYPNFEDNYFATLNGIKNVQRALNDVLDRKIEIIEGKSSDLLDNAQLNHLRILEKILQETISSRAKLETTSAEELKQRTSDIRDIIDSSRKKLMHIFERAEINCDGKVQEMLPQLTVEMGQHQRISIKTTTHDEHTTERVGFLGLRKEIVYFTVTDNTAETSSVVRNINTYSAKCKSFVNSEFKNIFNKEEFSQKIKDVVLTAFHQSQKAFDEDDVLLPLQNVLAKISIPHIEFDVTPYIDEIDTRFKSGYAKGEEIHQLSNLQSRVLNKIEVEISKQLVDALKEITEMLREQAVRFADQIEADFCNELEKLQKQAREKEKYIEEYHKFAKSVREMKTKMQTL